MFSFPTSIRTTEESGGELGEPFAFAAASARGGIAFLETLSFLETRLTCSPVTQIHFPKPRSSACVCPPVSARRTFEPRTRSCVEGFWETIAASPRCRDEASRAARDARTRVVECSSVRDGQTMTTQVTYYQWKKHRNLFPTVISSAQSDQRASLRPAQPETRSVERDGRSLCARGRTCAGDVSRNSMTENKVRENND